MEKFKIPGTGRRTFTVVMNEKWHLTDVYNEKYIIVGEPKKVEGGYEYEVKKYNERRKEDLNVLKA